VGDRYALEAAEIAGLHPGQAARIRVGGETAGWLGALHPRVAERLEVGDGTLVFQLDLGVVRAHAAGVPGYRPVPRLPATRRDLAVVVPEGVTAGALQEAAMGEVPGDLDLMDCRIFDVYTGEHVEAGTKSVGLALTLQPRDETPTDETIEAAVAAVVDRLAERLGARLRA
jgi:phenylalanyl-tRNA synthetase beta chain